MSSDHLITTTSRPDPVMSRGRGSWLWDESGDRYLDLVQGWAVNCLGHSPDAVGDAIAAQARDLLCPSPSFFNRPLLALAAELTRLTTLDRAFIATSGAEAVEVAIKLARTWGRHRRDGAWRIVTMQGAYHGRTLAAMSASGKPGWEDLFEPKVPGFAKVAPDDPAAVEAAITPDTCAVMLEPVLGEGGVIPFSDDSLRAIRRITRAAGVLLIHDEIQTGVGRTGRFLAGEHAGVRPDILVLGKGLGGGVPISAVLADQAVAACVAPGEQGGTFTGHPLGCAAALAVLREVTAPAFLTRVAHHGVHLRAGLSGLAAGYGLAGVRGRGLLCALDLGVPEAVAVATLARERGLLINAPRPHLLRFMPALNIAREELDLALRILDGCLHAVLRPGRALAAV